MSSQTKLWKAVLCLAPIGILLAVYLLYSYLTRPSFQPCSINTTVNCEALISGSLATTFGLPTASIGLTGYIFILLSTLFRRKKLLLAMASFGLVFCLSIAYQELFVLHVLCPICITCQLIMLTIFGIAIKLSKFF